jgi:hypothetical protein
VPFGPVVPCHADSSAGAGFGLKAISSDRKLPLAAVREDAPQSCSGFSKAWRFLWLFRTPTARGNPHCLFLYLCKLHYHFSFLSPHPSDACRRHCGQLVAVMSFDGMCWLHNDTRRFVVHDVVDEETELSLVGHSRFLYAAVLASGCRCICVANSAAFVPRK